MTTTTKPARESPAAKPAIRPEARRERTRRIGREVGTVALNAYERGVADVVALEKDAARIAPPWARNALTLSAELIEDIGAAYVKTARHVLR